MARLKNTSQLIFEQLNKLLLEKSCSSNIIDHNLEKGLANEQVFRDLLTAFFPNRYGVAKGKVINYQGIMSDQCDVIIYDKYYCPKLFIDDNGNQILPITGVYYVFEIKTTINSSILEQGFENLYSVYKVNQSRKNMSNNVMVEIRPPGLGIIGFKCPLKLDSIKKAYLKLNNIFSCANNFHSFSTLSPGYKEHSGIKYLVSEILILNRGMIHHMHNGSVMLNEFGQYTLGVFLTALIMILNWIELPKVDLLHYFNWKDAYEAIYNEAPKKKGQ